MTGHVCRAYAYTTIPNIEKATEFPIVLNFDNVDTAGSNSPLQFSSGARTLAHELCHACGLYHAFEVGWDRRAWAAPCTCLAPRPALIMLLWYKVCCRIVLFAAGFGVLPFGACLLPVL